MLIKEFIKKYPIEIGLFIGLFVVFFITRLKPNEPKKIDLSKITTIVPITNSNKEPSIEINNINQNPNELPAFQNPGAAPANIQATNNEVNPNPYAALINNTNSGPSSIKDSLGNLRAETPSTEAIIERNAYFKKLSDQLKELQGNVNSEEEKPGTQNPSSNTHNDNQHPETLSEEEDLATDEELDLEE